MDWIRFGVGIRALRHRHRWRQEDLGREARVSRSAIGRVERGRGDRLPHTTLARNAASVGRLLVVSDGPETRRRLLEHDAIFRSAFPARGWDVRRGLAAPHSVAGWCGLWIPADDRAEGTATE